MPRTAIITGASSGIGKAFVKALLESSDCPDKIWIAARRIDRLNEMAQLSDKLVPVQADLLVADGIGVIKAKLQAENPDVTLLINCAGMGKKGKIADRDASDIADTVTDVGSIVNKRNGVQIVQQFVSDTQEQFNSIEQTQQGIGQQFGSDKGIVESIVGLVTDNTMGKPQRRRAIHEYMDNSLIPSFKAELERLAVDTVGKIKAAVEEGIEAGMEEMTRSLETLRSEQKEKHDAYVSRISSLRDYRNELLNF